ncbi:type I-F CRISPR-associated protein Csy1 [Vibrio sp. D431a]|uniref:type I-F CRISPR-associated protein Csy1 n=1 Tax=Vibrio sp. D431a TaxID=2837388 RepID=UPI0025527073|nr:type I-F CRISPR-associated protein Csy1 [Vibrio sp. D431a]MDK9790065.1 type I-F CRISPR-associated protein Csy1 [Vibrio sp. D431a]
MTATLTKSIKDFIAERHLPKQEKLKKEREVAISKANIDTIDTIEQGFTEKLHSLQSDFLPHNWLDNELTKISQIRICTHTSSYPNSSANGANIANPNFEIDERYLDTDSTPDLPVDIGGNAAAFSIGRLLFLTDSKKKTLKEYILDNDSSPLSELAQSKDQLEHWMSLLKGAFNYNDLKSHHLARQVYFPNDDGSYTILAPLYPLAIVHKLSETINHSRYSEEMKEIRKARREGKHHDKALVNFHSLGALKLGGSKPQNVSYLNSKRGGINYFLPCTPPQVESSDSRSINGSIFESKQVNSSAFPYVKELTRLYATAKRKGQVNKELSKKIQKATDSIVDAVISISFEWSFKIKEGLEFEGIPPSQLAWINERHRNEYYGDWASEVSQDFSLWLLSKVNKLAGDAYTLGESEAYGWSKDMKNALRRLK